MSAEEEALRRWFGFGTFRPGQEAVVRAVLSGRDTVVVMPTGSGKSLCFQLPALMLEGTTIVVSPLIALMKDQVDALRARHIPATFLNSTLSSDETTLRLAQLRMGHYKLVYVAPERFRNPRFLEALNDTPLSMLAIDEAHCISSWGHDFRPDYLHLGEVVGRLPATVRLIAVTATATDAVRRDIAEHLALGRGGRADPEVFVTGFERPNLALNVTRVRTHSEKLERLLQIIEFFRTGIVYCSTRRMVERVQGLLAEHGVRALAYNGAMDDADRTHVQDAFMRRETPVVVATNAFGMGVDRPDIRFVTHWDVPGSLEAYYQEVGRAGRDGAYAWCELFFNYADVRTQEFFIASANPPAEHVYELYAAIRNACAQSEGGEATLSPEAWAERAGIKSPLAVRTLVAVFERNGLLHRVRHVGSPYSAISVPKENDIPTLKRICAALSKKDATDRERLRDMLDYVDARGCRHRFLLAYFGERTAVRTCSKCDVCHPIRTFPARLTPDAARLTELRKILSCVARLHGQGDYALVAAVLRGEASQGFRSLTTFGILPDASAEAIAQACEALEMDGYLIGMRLTSAGYDLVLGKTTPGPIATFRSGHVRIPSTEPSRKPLPRASAKPPLDTGATSAGVPGPTLRGGLATALRAWVREEAERRALPVYCVLQSKTIAHIARRRPATFDELALIPGLGETRCAKYGEAILAIVAAYCDEAGM